MTLFLLLSRSSRSSSVIFPLSPAMAMLPSSMLSADSYFLWSLIGPKTDPGGISLVTSVQPDSPFNATCCCCPFSHFLPHLALPTPLPISIVSSFTNNVPCGTISKASLKSRQMGNIEFPLLTQHILFNHVGLTQPAFGKPMLNFISFSTYTCNFSYSFLPVLL